MKRKKNKKTTSKTLVTLSILQFFAMLIYTMLGNHFGIDNLEILPYLIPSSSAICATAIGFYFNKSKIENLSKQRIRYVYLKLLLQDKLPGDIYQEIEDELCHIDDMIYDKLNDSLSESINKDINVEN